MQAVRHILASLRRIPARVARWAWKHPWPTLAVAAALSVVSLWAAEDLKLEADLSVLLPEHFESVQGIAELEERFGGVGYVVVVAQGAAPEQLVAFADALAPKLEALDTIRYVDYERPLGFFESHALLYLPLETLEDIAQKVEARIKWEKQQKNPMYIDLDDEPAPSLDLEELDEAYSSQGGEWLAKQTGKYYMDEESRTLVLLAKPTAVASDLSFAASLVADTEAVIAAMDLSPYGPDLDIQLTGRYKKNLEQQERISADLGDAFLLAFLLLIGYLVIHLRSVVSMLLVVVPLGLGLVWMLGATGSLYDSLNILTGFLGAILLGLGIDHGIHLMSRYRNEHARRPSASEALAHTFEHTATAVVIAALTTASAFAALAISEFRAFHEFGIIAAIGLIAVLVSYTTVLPALLSLVDKLRWRPPRPPSKPGIMVRFAGAMGKWAPVALWVPVVVGAFLVFAAPDFRFNYDFGALEGGKLPAFVLDQKTNELLGYSQTPVAILTEDAEEEAALTAALRAAKEAKGPSSTIDFIASVADLVPPDQAAKKAVMAKLGKTIGSIKLDKLDEELGADLGKVDELLAAELFARSELPIEIRRQFMGVGDDEGGFVLIFPSISLADGIKVRAFAEEIRGVVLPDGSSSKASGEAMVLADILGMIEEEAPPILAITLALIILITWVLLGGIRDALKVLAPVAALTVALFGLLGLLDVELNYMNIIVIPILLGVGVDGAVHLLTRTQEDGASWDVAVGETSRAILGAFLTTGIGFGALLVAEHPGLDSIGQLSLIGFGVDLVVIVMAFTAALALGRAHRELTSGAPLLDRLAALGATVGYAGHSPVAPGTLGAFVALPLAFGLGALLLWAAILVTILAVAGSVAVTDRYLKAFGAGDPDPSAVVLDEVVGLLVASLFVPATVPWLLAAFVAFRVFDIAKPWPVGLIDRRTEGAVGVIMDDVVAGLMAGGALLVIKQLVETFL